MDLITLLPGSGTTCTNTRNKLHIQVKVGPPLSHHVVYTFTLIFFVYLVERENGANMDTV